MKVGKNCGWAMTALNEVLCRRAELQILKNAVRCMAAIPLRFRVQIIP